MNQNSKVYKAIIFDLDGVICFTDEYHFGAWKVIADKEGIYFDREINNRLRGVSRMESLEIILEKANKEYSQQEKLDLAETKNSVYVQMLNQMSEKDLTDEVRETLSILKEREYLLAIGSSSKNARKILELLGCTHYFDAISDGTNIINSKPNPEVFLKAAEYLDVLPSDCLVVEDAIAGIQAAVAGGFDSVGVGEAAEYSETTYPIQTFSNLLDI